MRLLLFADLHLDAPFAWAPARLARARRSALREALNRICHLAVTGTGGRVVLRRRPLRAGTLHPRHGRLRTGGSSPGYIRCRCTSLRGNQDWLGPASLYRQVEWTDNVRVFTTERLEPVTLTDGFTLRGPPTARRPTRPGSWTVSRSIEAG